MHAISNSKKGNTNRYILYLLLLTFIIGLHLRIQYVNHTIIYKPLRGDAGQYVTYGRNLVLHGVFSKDYASNNPVPDSLRSPGYPLLIALAMFLARPPGFYRLIIDSQILISALMVFLTYALGVLFLPRWYAIIAAIFVAFSPHLISLTSNILSETLFSFMLLLSILTFVMALKRNKAFLFISSGLFFGYAYLTNETSLFIPFLFTIHVFLSKSFRKKMMSNRISLKLILFIVIFALFPICWNVRNSVNVPADAPRSSQRAFQTISHGAYPGFIYQNREYLYYPYREDPKQPEFGSSLESFLSIFWERFKKRPLRYMSWYLFEKPYYFWSWDNLQSQWGGEKTVKVGDIYVYQGDIYALPVVTSLYHTALAADLTRKIMKYLHPVILLIALSGVLLFIIERPWRNSRNYIQDPLLYLFTIIFFFTLIYTLFASWPRYSVPLRPELYLFAMWGIKTMADMLSRKKVPVRSIRGNNGI